MEFIAWSNHKYIMHGFLWKWHKDHHLYDQRKVALDETPYFGFQKNDLFFMIYATPTMFLVMSGLFFNIPALLFIGAGFTIYGFFNFIIHDIIIHHRLRIPFLQKNHSFYIKAAIEAHLAHHRPKTAQDFQNFGLLIFPIRYFKK